MSVASTISHARSYLPDNPGAYARLMSAAIRSALSDRAANAYRKAIADDRAAHLFARLDTSSPTSRI